MLWNERMESNYFALIQGQTREPAPGSKDTYSVAAVFNDEMHIFSFVWQTPSGCPRCNPDQSNLPSQITIVTGEKEKIILVCSQQ